MAGLFKNHRRPPQGEIIKTGIADKYSTYPSNGLTPQRLAAIFQAADDGDVSRQMELFTEMEEKDPHLAAQLQTRKQAVTGLDFEVLPFDAAAETDREIAQFVAEQLHGIADFEDICTDLLDAIGKGFAVAEIIWGNDGSHITIDAIRPKPQKRFFWDENDRFLAITDAAPAGQALPENKLIFHRYKARSGHPSRGGILRVVAWMYLFKNYSLKDWVSFCDVFGQPLRLGKYAPGASEDDKSALLDALRQLGTDAAGMIPTGTDINFVDAAGKAGTADIYRQLAEYADAQISKAVLGQTLTADSGGGSYAQSKTHNDVRHDLTVADCKALAATLRRDLIRPLVLYNYGPDAHIPHIRWDCEESADLKATAEIYRTLACDIGLPIPYAHLYDKFGLPKPKNGEAVAVRPNAQPDMSPLRPLSLSAQDTPQLQEAIRSQQRLDVLADAATDASAGAFDRMIIPLRQLAADAADIDALAAALADNDTVLQLTQRMDAGALEELICRVSYLADMGGRAREKG